MITLERTLQPGQSWVRKAIDPAGMLPQVTLEADCNDFDFADTVAMGTDSGYPFQVMRNGSRIGRVVYERTVDSDALSIRGITINSRHPDYAKGSGMATYLIGIETALQRGKAFESDYVLSDSAMRIWQILLGAGVAREADSFTRYRSVYGTYTTIGWAVVEPKTLTLIN